VDATVDRFGRLDILVANAGVGSYHPFLETPPEHVEEMIDVNLKGTIYAVRAALPRLLEAGEADIVAIASEAGRRAAPNQAVYCASKFGQVGFMRALDHELRAGGVRCTSVCPGGTATDFALDDGYGRSAEAVDGMMRPQDVAEVVLFVLTRPRHMRVLEATLRPMKEASWG
jgi:3-oxoacyl-[acyl-carrier protein] reductase